MKINKYFPFAFVYFFLNMVALPFGLTWMTLLAPLFYVWTLLIRKQEVLLPFIAMLIPFIIAHIWQGVDAKTYSISLLNLILVYVFCQAVYTFLLVCKDPEIIFRRILILNFIFCLVAVVLYFTPWSNWLWMEQTITSGLSQFRRLKLLTYEPSYYALLLIPVFFFYLLQYFFRQNTIPGGLLLLILFVPYILSFSIGVISAGMLAIFLTWLIHFKKLTSKRRVLNSIINLGAVLGSLFAFTLVFFRNNPLFLRFTNVFTGNDTSAKGRTIDAFKLAWNMIKDGNEYWGIGVGQIKVVGENLIRNYYLYPNEVTVAIPNAAAETLAIFGLVGLILRLSFEIFFFFYTRVWNNYYRLLLFIFMFIYQFTGSFITNGAEYVIWILAFTNVFKQFDIKKSEP